MLAVLIGFGSNEVMIPLLVFDNFEQGKTHLEKLFGVSGTEEPSKNNKLTVGLEWNIDEIELEELDEEELGKIALQATSGPSREVRKSLYEKFNGIPDSRAEYKKELKKLQKTGKSFPVDSLFVSYCSGCGGCYRVQLVEVENGKPFVTWNLD